MRAYIFVLVSLFLGACSSQKGSQVEITNVQMKDYSFLKIMYDDDYFPNVVVDKGKAILMQLCRDIEIQKPQNLESLYRLTLAATNQFNNLQRDFYAHDSEIETGAAECIALDFLFISQAYGFEADIEKLIATRDW